MKFFLFFFIIFSTLHAQVSQTTAISYNQTSENPHFTQDKTFNTYITSNHHLPFGASQKGIGLTKLDECNNEIWSKVLYKSNLQLDHFQTFYNKHDNHIYIIGSYKSISLSDKKLMVIRLDVNGKVKHAKAFDFGTYLFNYAYSGFSTANGITIASKFAPLGGGASYTTLISMDSTLEISHSYRHHNTFTGISTTQINDNVYFLRSASSVFLAHRDGSIFWAKEYPELLIGSNFFNALNAKDGYIILVRRLKGNFLVKFDLDGNFVWKSDVFETDSWPKIILNNDSSIQAVSYIDNGSITQPVIITYSSNGKRLSQKMINDINTSVTGYPDFISHKNFVNLLFSTGNSNDIIFIQNPKHLQCIDDISIPKVDNIYSEVSNSISITSTPLVETNQTINLDFDTLPIAITSIIRCEPILIEDTLITDGKIDCDVNYTFTGTTNASYYWPQDGSFSSEKELDSTGIYEVVIENCRSKTREFIHITDICNCDLFVPNAFTPNNDLHNNTFGAIDNCGVSFYSINIYDRWGKKIFTSQNINKHWDGTYKGYVVSSGLYFYTIEYTPLSLSPSVKNLTRQGYVMVI